jgi:elongin-C
LKNEDFVDGLPRMLFDFVLYVGKFVNKYCNIKALKNRSRNLFSFVSTLSHRHRRRLSSIMSISNNDEVTYVKLVSAEGIEFYADRNIVMAGSGTIRTMLEGTFRESNENLIRFPDIAGCILERIVKYIYYKAQHSQSNTRVPEFTIEPEIALELLIAAKYLDC